MPRGPSIFARGCRVLAGVASKKVRVISATASLGGSVALHHGARWSLVPIAFGIASCPLGLEPHRRVYSSPLLARLPPLPTLAGWSSEPPIRPVGSRLPPLQASCLDHRGTALRRHSLRLAPSGQRRCAASFNRSSLDSCHRGIVRLRISAVRPGKSPGTRVSNRICRRLGSRGAGILEADRRRARKSFGQNGLGRQTDDLPQAGEHRTPGRGTGPRPKKQLGRFPVTASQRWCQFLQPAGLTASVACLSAGVFCDVLAGFQRSRLPPFGLENRPNHDQGSSDPAAGQRGNKSASERPLLHVSKSFRKNHLWRLTRHRNPWGER